MIPQKPFGRTGHLSTRTIFGAAALGSVTQKEADRTLELLLKYGINHIDTAASYGESELRIGPWMREHRKDFFLATKTEKRTYQGAKDELKRSLERLQVEQVDLWQMHFLVDPDDLKTALAPGGALEAFIEAKDEGLVRYLGVTGHGLIIPSHLETCLDNYSFDSILLPFNFIQMQNPLYPAALRQKGIRTTQPGMNPWLMTGRSPTPSIGYWAIRTYSSTLWETSICLRRSSWLLIHSKTGRQMR